MASHCVCLLLLVVHYSNVGFLFLNLAPARIGSFSQAIRKAVGTSLLLECLAVGNPTPRALWYTKGRAITFSQFYKVTDDGNLKIHKVEYSLSGNYTCTAKNIYGNDSIEYQLIAMKPPSSPTIIVQYASADSIRLSWDKIDDGGAPIQGFVISYQPKNSKWLTVDVTPELKSFLLTDLKCGTQYAIKISAYNGIGTSRPSDEVLVWTKGKSISTYISITCNFILFNLFPFFFQLPHLCVCLIECNSFKCTSKRRFHQDEFKLY